ncbi:helix-turn-helix domain-containing protein [Shewanella baltica]|uniref:helix-turn-helix domain-containing protein n=1 Tax=Shewanella baltica TaxID=62322 RepID=UPI00217D9A8C|nr:helix-turn-helix domain-containing protein [Shewanella baltica]MCS6098640.1 transcriptional regulator [Shewanella baltica]MCS6181826.1 transcriptional regulator [Shewanella baltica]
MSMELMVKAMKAKVGNPLRKLVLIKLADNANDQGECWPSYQNIAEQCEITRRSVMNHVKTLEDDGFLRREYRKGEKGNSTNIFHIRFEAMAPKCKADAAVLGGEANSLSPNGADLPPSECGSLSPSEANSPPSEYGSPASERGSPPLVNLVHPESINLESINESLKDSCPATSAKSVFNAFFKAYPAHRKGGSDSAAWKAWKAEKLTDADCVLAVSWLKEAAALDTSWGFSANGQFVLGITKFIRERHWLTPLPRPMATAVGQVDWSYAVYDPEDPLI